MRPERYLGSDPSEGELEGVDDVVGILREVVLVLAESRQRLGALLAVDSVWQGRHTRDATATLGVLTERLRTIEDSAVVFLQALGGWRAGLAERKDRTAVLAETATQLADRPEADDRREQVRTQAAQVASEHRRDATALVRAAEEFLAALAVPDGARELPTDLDRALTGLRVQIEAWVAESEQAMGRALSGLTEVSGLTSVVHRLMAVGPQVGPDPESPAVAALTAHAAGAHRLGYALAHEWAPWDGPLPAASFGYVGSVAARLRRLASGGDA